MATDAQTITASSGVETTYYGKPVIKAPHWRWLIIIYFFLGGLAGGCTVVASLAELVKGDRVVVRAGRYISFLAFLPCPVLLILDLGRPERFLNMLRIVKLRSPMSLGSWAVLVLGGLSTLGAMLQLAADLFHPEIPSPAVQRSVHRGIAMLGLPFGAFVAGYTGILLAATNVPLWARSSFLMGPTFLCSAFSTSLAAISAVLGFGGGERETTARQLARAEAACLAAELSLLTVGVLRLGKLGRPLTTGRWGMLFWPLTYVGGVLIALVLQLSGRVRGKSGSQSRRTATALLVLIGGFVLRMVMIFAGRESARRPEDYFALTQARSR